MTKELRELYDMIEKSNTKNTSAAQTRNIL
jgi:hypothetical protein